MGITYASLPNRAKNISALLSSVGVEGIGPSLAAIGTIDAEVFEAYLEWILLPKMPPESLMARDYLSPKEREGRRADRGAGWGSRCASATLLARPEPDRRSLPRDRGPTAKSASPHRDAVVEAMRRGPM
jgi:hypothetical protein